MTGEERDDATSPPAGTPAEATPPPGKGEVDEEAVKEPEEKLGEAGAGHQGGL